MSREHGDRKLKLYSGILNHPDKENLMSVGDAKERFSINAFSEKIEELNRKLDTQQENIEKGGRKYVIIKTENGKESIKGSNSLWAKIVNFFSSGTTGDAARVDIKNKAKVELGKAITDITIYSDKLNQQSANLLNQSLDAASYSKQLQDISVARLALKGTIDKISITIDKISKLSDDSQLKFESKEMLESHMKDVQKNLQEAQKANATLQKEAHDVLDKSKDAFDSRLNLDGTQKTVDQALADVETTVVDKIKPAGLARLTEDQQKTYRDNVMGVIDFNMKRIEGELKQPEIGSSRLLELADSVGKANALLDKFGKQFPDKNITTEKERLQKMSSDIIAKAKSNFPVELNASTITEEYRILERILTALGKHGFADPAKESREVRERISSQMATVLDNKVSPLSKESSTLGFQLLHLNSQLESVNRQASFKKLPEIMLPAGIRDVPPSVESAIKFLNLVKKFQKHFDELGEPLQKEGFPNLVSEAHQLGIQLNIEDDQESVWKTLSENVGRFQSDLGDTTSQSIDQEVLSLMQLDKSPSAVKSATEERWKLKPGWNRETEQRDVDLRTLIIKLKGYDQLQQIEKEDTTNLEMLKADFKAIEKRAKELGQKVEGRFNNNIEAGLPSEMILKEILIEKDVTDEIGKQDPRKMMANPTEYQLFLIQLEGIAKSSKSVNLRANLLTLRALDIKQSIDKENSALEQMVSNKEQNYKEFVRSVLDKAITQEESLRSKIAAAMKRDYGELMNEVGKSEGKDRVGEIALRQMSGVKAKEGLQIASQMLEARTKLASGQKKLLGFRERYQQVKAKTEALESERKAIAQHSVSSEDFLANLQTHINVVTAPM